MLSREFLRRAAAVLALVAWPWRGRSAIAESPRYVPVATRRFRCCWSGHGPIDMAALCSVVGCVNAAEWRGHPAGTLRLRGATWTRTCLEDGSVSQETEVDFDRRYELRWCDAIAADGRGRPVVDRPGNPPHQPVDFTALGIPADAPLEAVGPVVAESVAIPA